MTLLAGTVIYAQSADPATQLANTRQALSELNARISTAVSAGLSGSGQTRTLLADRHDLVVRILRDDPANSRTYALDPDLRTSLLAADSSAPTLIEQESAITGELVGSVADDFEHHTSTMHYVLHTYSRDTDLSFANAIPGIDRMLHRQVTVRGVGLPEIMATDSLADVTPAVEQSALLRAAASSASSSELSPPPAVCSTTGVQNIAVLLVTFPGNTPAFPTGLDQAAYWNSVLFGANPSVNGFWNEVSYGQTSAVGNVFGPFALSQSYDCTTTSMMQTAAIAAAVASGTVDFTQYNRIVIAFPASTCTFGGLANIGCGAASSTINHQYSVVWLPIMSNYTSSYPQMWGGASHELGHNLGLNHANTLDFGSITLGPLDFTASNPGTVASSPPPSVAADPGAAPASSITAVNTEYGDDFAVIGYPWIDGGPYSAEHRVKLLGWIPQSDERDITASGTFTLVPAEHSSGLRALHVLRDPTSDSWMWIEFHQPTGYYTPNNMAGWPGNNLSSGAQIHYETGSMDDLHTFLLDMTPVAVSNNFLNSTLAPGTSWSDPYSLLTVTAGTQTSSSLGVTVSYDTPCATLSLSPSLLSAAGGTANLTIAAPSTCSWSASSNASWISFSGTTSSSGNATIPFTYTANTTTAQRNSYITAQRQSVPLVQSGTGINILSLTPNVGSSAVTTPVPITLNYSDGLGIQDVTQVNLDFAGIGTPDCQLAATFNGSSAFLYLFANGAYTSDIVAGGTGSLSTASCTVSGAGSSYTASGNKAVLTVNISFTSTFIGTHSITASGVSSANGLTATLPLGYWVVGDGSDQTSLSSFSISPSTVTAGGSTSLNFTLSATAPTSGASVTLASSNSSAFPVVGSFTIPAGQTTGFFSNQSGTTSSPALVTVTASYNSSSQQAQVTVNPASVPIIIFTVPNHTYGDAPFTVSATSNSSGAMTYSVVSGSATISGSTVTLTGAGTVVLQVSQAAAGNYPLGTQTATFTVATESQTITFTALTSPVIYGVSPITLAATGGASGNAVVFSVVSGPATVSGSTLTITGVGTVVVAANQAGNTNYAAAMQVTQSIVVNVIGAAATPTFSPVAGTYTTTQSVTISDTTTGATIYYTTDGSTPTPLSSKFTAAITVSSIETLQAIATATGYSMSAVASAAYTLANPQPAISGISPAFTNAGGTVFDLTVSGSGFTTSSAVYWGTSALATAYVSATQLKAQVPAADIAAVGAIAITVQSPTPGGGTSNAWQFEVDSASGTTTAPTITSTTETVSAGSTASYPVTVPSSVTSISVSCLNLPTGATCSYSSTTNALTIATSSNTPKGTYQITVVFTETVTGAAFLLPILLLPLGFIRRKGAARGIWLTACLGLVLLVTVALSIGCGSGGGSSSTTPPLTQQVTSSGSISLTIQ
jgi:hypothetical protein